MDAEQELKGRVSVEDDGNSRTVSAETGDGFSLFRIRAKAATGDQRHVIVSEHRHSRRFRHEPQHQQHRKATFLSSVSVLKSVFVWSPRLSFSFCLLSFLSRCVCICWVGTASLWLNPPARLNKGAGKQSLLGERREDYRLTRFRDVFRLKKWRFNFACSYRSKCITQKSITQHLFQLQVTLHTSA